MKIGILGGTFDPIHQGHLLLAQSAKSQFNLDKVLFIPALIPPHKTSRRDLTPAPYRFRMVELALKNHSGFEISDIEFNRPEVSYTVDTLRALKKIYPQDELFLIMGADAAAEISSWREPEAIFQMASVLAAKRPGYKVKAPSPKIQWIQMPACGTAASGIRQCFEEGEKLETGILPEEVEKYIHKMNLYQKAKREPSR